MELGWGASVIGELTGPVTLVVSSFDKGGAPLVAAYVASRTLLSMVVTLGIAGLSSSTRTSVLLRRITVLRAVLLALAALTAALYGELGRAGRAAARRRPAHLRGPTAPDGAGRRIRRAGDPVTTWPGGPGQASLRS